MIAALLKPALASLGGHLIDASIVSVWDKGLHYDNVWSKEREWNSFQSRLYTAARFKTNTSYQVHFNKIKRSLPSYPCGVNSCNGKTTSNGHVPEALGDPISIFIFVIHDDLHFVIIFNASIWEKLSAVAESQTTPSPGWPLFWVTTALLSLSLVANVVRVSPESIYASLIYSITHKLDTGVPLHVLGGLYQQSLLDSHDFLYIPFKVPLHTLS